MAVKLNAKLYRNTGTYASPVWTEIKNVVDLSLPNSKDSVDTSTRGNGGFKTSKGKQKSIEPSWKMKDKSGDADLIAIRAAYFADTEIEFAIMDGDIAVSGSEGIRVLLDITGFSRDEPLSGDITYDITTAPVDNTNAPEWLVIA